MNSHHNWCVDLEMNQRAHMQQLIRSNRSMYPQADEISTLTIPYTAIQGRAGNSTMFTGYINLETGHMRIDSDNPDFWLEIQLGELAGLKYMPGGEGAKEAEDEFNHLMNTRNKKRKCASE